MRTVGTCPACHKEIIMQAICPNCNFNIDIFEKAKRISISLYNKGLEEYNTGYILDSITTLEKSLDLYKNNILARNLLGIIYYQIGEVGMALKHWVISSNMKKEDNPASKYLEDMNKEKATLDKKNEAVKIYNEALGYAKQGNDDIAIIRLQKAINLSPEFIKAYILLSLCYFKDEETKDKAKQYLDKAKQIDKRSSIMKYYNREICGEQIISVSDNKNKNVVKEKVYREKTSGDLYFYIGNLKINKVWFGCIVSILLTLLFSFKFGGFDKIAKDNAKLNDANKEYKKELKTAEDNVENLTQELDQYKLDEKKEKDKINLNNAIEEYNAKNYKEAYKLFKDINKDLLDDSLVNSYNNLNTYLIKEVAKEYYNEGKECFENEDYTKALEKLNASLECTNQESFSAEAMYYIARVYEKTDEATKAKEMYTRIINEFPDTHSAETASYRIGLLSTNN